MHAALVSVSAGTTPAAASCRAISARRSTCGRGHPGRRATACSPNFAATSSPTSNAEATQNEEDGYLLLYAAAPADNDWYVGVWQLEPADDPAPAPPPQQADVPPPPAPLQEPLKAIDKANAVEERVMEQKEAQDRAMEAQEGG